MAAKFISIVATDGISIAINAEHIICAREHTTPEDKIECHIRLSEDMTVCWQGTLKGLLQLIGHP